MAIKGISSKSFLAYFHEEDMDKLDISFLKIGFANVRKTELEDLIPMRKTWVECRGLPIIVWSENNFIEIVKRWGSILQFSKSVDDEGFFQNLCFLIETREQSRIELGEEIMIQNKLFHFKLVECEGKSWVPNIVKDEEDCDIKGSSHNHVPNGEYEHNFELNGDHNHFLQSDVDGLESSPILGAKDILLPDPIINVEPGNSNLDADNLHKGGNTSPPGISHASLIARSEGRGGESGEINSFINPLTPRKGFGILKWDTREEVDTGSLSNSPISLISLPISSCSAEGKFINCSSNSSVLRDLDSLKLRSNRGRPRKMSVQKANKYFKVPTNRKKKKMKKGMADSISIKWADMGEVVDEAEAILETDLHMGLIIVKYKDSSLKLIKENLQV